MNKLIKLIDLSKLKKLIFIITFLSFNSWSQTIKNINELPNNLNWTTNNSDPIFSSDKAQKGGSFRLMIADFPTTFRYVGPSSNSSFRGFINSNRLSLTNIHPQTDNDIPELATHWAVMADNKTVFYKLNKSAKWSDGKPIMADDYLFTLDFMRSKHIVAPWYNDYYSKEIVNITKYDDWTISVTLGTAQPSEDVLSAAGIAPTPKHFHKLNENWVRWANWKIEPNSGAYIISNFRKGRYIDFEHKKNWWGENLRYFKNRFNVNKVRIKVVRNVNIGWNMFLKGDLDSFGLVSPEYWHERSKVSKFDKGWIRKFWFYNEKPQPSSGIYFNLEYPLFKDIKVRKAIAYALNIKKMNATIMQGDYQQLPNFSTGYGEYTNPNIKARLFDLGKANNLLDEAGWTEKNNDGVRIKSGETLSFKLNYSQSSHSPRLAFLKNEMLKAGIDMQLQLLAGASGYKNIMQKKHQAAWSGWGTGLRPAYWQFFHSDNAIKPNTNNINNFADPKMDELTIAYRESTNKKDRIKLAHQIQQLIYDSGAIIPTYMVPYTREGAWAYIRLPKNIAPKTTASLFEPMGLSTFWIDKEIKQKIQNKEQLKPETIIDEKYKLVN